MDEWVDWALDHGSIDSGVGQRVRILGRLMAQSPLSGQTMAGLLGVSRSAVHKHVATLRSLGIELASAPGSGYRLSPTYDELVPEVVLPLLLGSPEGPAPGAPTMLGLPYLFISAVDSTNRVLKELLQSGAPAGAVVATDAQLGGRGRLGRRWISQPGLDVTFSVGLRPVIAPDRVHLLVLSASVAVADSLSLIPGLAGRVGIKWPNDVLVDGRKVCGILSEASMDMDRIHWAVLGIGLNVNGRVEAARFGDRGEGRPVPGSLAQLSGDRVPRALLLACVLDRLRQRLGQVTGGDWGAVRDSYRSFDVLAGTSVEVHLGGDPEQSVAEGVARGIGELGELLVEDRVGTLLSVTAGEVTLGGSADSR